MNILPLLCFGFGLTNIGGLLFVIFIFCNFIGQRFQAGRYKIPALQQALFVSGYFMETPFWIEKAWGDQVDNATMDDVRVAIKETINMDDEHGAFWVGHNEKENVLEVHKNWEIFYVFNDDLDDQLKTKLNSWQEVEYLYQQFFDDNYEQIKSFIETRINGDQN